jgi:uracil phosphoribosyltransferase
LLCRAAPVYHLGLFREKVTLQPVECSAFYSCYVSWSDCPSDYSKLPPSPPIDMVFLLDPLIATGGTACAALSMIVDWGIQGMFGVIPLCFRFISVEVRNIKLLCVLASREGLKHVQAEYPDLEVIWNLPCLLPVLRRL